MDQDGVRVVVEQIDQAGEQRLLVGRAGRVQRQVARDVAQAPLDFARRDRLLEHQHAVVRVVQAMVQVQVGVQPGADEGALDGLDPFQRAAQQVARMRRLGARAVQQVLSLFQHRADAPEQAARILAPAGLVVRGRMRRSIPAAARRKWPTPARAHARPARS